MLIKDLPKEIQERVFECQRNDFNLMNSELDLKSSKKDGNFTWMNTIEGHDFWSGINKGNYSAFHRRYPEKLALMEAALKKEEEDLLNFLNS